MNAFLDKLAVHLLDRYGDTLGQQCIVFPNRRSGVFFKYYLKNAMNGSAWLPEIHTINSFMEALSGMTYADPVDLNFELYRIYSRLVNNPEPYDEFFYWGEMMISDFNDIDKYLVNADDLFTNIADLKEIENVFDYLSSEQKELILQFWSHFREKDLSPEQASFLGIWKILQPMYTNLRSKLRETNTGYEGMIYREVSGRIALEDYPDIENEKVIICGFNALSTAERQLFSYLRDSGKGDFYWDYDQQYREGNMAEAGRFIRRNLEEFPAGPGFPDDFINLGKPKRFRVFNLPSDVLQTKKLHELLNERAFPETDSFNDTAIILGDEDMLQPVLSSLPEEIPGLNITMGYPLKNTPVFSFVENLLRLQRNMSTGRERKSGSFYFRDVLSVINHQYVRAIAEKDASILAGEINTRNMIYISPSFFNGHELFPVIFRKIDDAPSMTDYISEILDVLVKQSLTVDDEKHWFTLEREFIFHIKTRLNKLHEIFSNNPVDTSIETFTRLFRKIMNSSRIPFEGEPLQGIQLMGILETRILDFKNVLFLSLNEGVMPASSQSLSYIPANLRYAFGMPTREDKDAIYAYYFYRLIQRAEHIDIMYNSKTEGVNSGEPARYIYQLKYLFDTDIRFETVSFKIGEKKAEAISIEKTPDVLAKLAEYTSLGKRKLSPTSLTTWLDCPLRFYFTHVAGIREEDEVAEDIDASAFGILLHRTMELLYGPYTGHLINRDEFDLLSDNDNIKKCLDQAFRDEFLTIDDTTTEVVPEGR
ncbi:MAG TPA: PD-(D/E)XK nuclease family protein, partial [Bacteroidales bacterium]|nr:PD-(D/E)XK nuclease family protein [Bacteroidales bacterium]